MNSKQFLLIGTILIFSAVFVWIFGVVKPRGDILGMATLQLETDEKIVALTFDDGPSPQYTDQILTILRQKGILATFYVVGENIDKYPNVLKRIDQAGHEIGNHTNTHKLMTFMSYEDVAHEIQVAEEKIYTLIKVRPKTFRAPYAWYNPNLPRLISFLKLQIIGWNIDSHDWKKPGVDRIVSNVVDNIEPGSIILMHDGSNEDDTPNRDQTITALARIIDQLEDKGYTFLTVTDLLSYSQSSENDQKTI